VFDSIDGAVRCGIKVQRELPVHDADQPVDRAIRFRIGINLGDAIPDGTDLHGDAVNVAARLQAECPPGGICVSRSPSSRQTEFIQHFHAARRGFVRIGLRLEHPEQFILQVFRHRRSRKDRCQGGQNNSDTDW
jgi:class 3 adenylate cyclase